MKKKKWSRSERNKRILNGRELELESEMERDGRASATEGKKNNVERKKRSSKCN